ncbi:MAG: HAD family hydrolase [Nodosilinea sp.]
MLEALLFDLDGTLANTDPIHLRVWRDLLAPQGYDVDEDFFQTHISGRLNADLVQNLLPQLSPAQGIEFSAHKEALFRQLAADQLQPTPGLFDLLAWADHRHLPAAVVTNAPRENAEFILQTLGLAQRFQAVVIAGDLPRAKPDPMPYLAGLQRLNMTADQAIAFEDSTTGVAAAVGAGLYTVGLTTTHSPAELDQAGAHLIVADFKDPALEALGLWPLT